MTRYSRFRRRTPLHVFVRAAARPLPKICFGPNGKTRQTHSRRGCPYGVRFTLTRNEGLSIEMGYHGVLWASTGTGFTNVRTTTGGSGFDGTPVFILY